MRLTIFGSGYVGLVTGACLADVGHHVMCVDTNQKKIDNLKNGIVPIYEPGLDHIIERNFDAGRLEFTTDPKIGISHAHVIFIAVGTPPEEDGSADVSAVLAVAQTIAQNMTDYKLIVNKSTVPVGSADSVRAVIQKTLESSDRNIAFDVASNPEFLKEGNAVDDFSKPDRIVVGTDCKKAEILLGEIYAPFNRRNSRIINMDIRSAELTKYAANAMLATKISFMNQMALLAEKLGADIEQVRLGIGSDERIGYHFIYAGAGYGGSCFPKDVKALAATAKRVGMTANLIEAVEAVNENQKKVIGQKIMAYFANDIKGKTFALWGLSFKPNTDDMRDAPARVLMEFLWKNGASVRAYDPKAMQECQHIYGARDGLTLCTSANETLTGSDALVVLTEWREFMALDTEKLKSTLKNPVVFDGRNIYTPQVLKAEGIIYYGIGR